MFAPKKSASASHILVKGNNAANFLTELKYSSCPSGKKGGSLGTFKQGQMVPAFDKVVFTEEVGRIHGPVMTPFGGHLILIEARE
ncbi:peptidyl-prolyl cis-trans isomerase C [Ochromonadaceae sp. CCMP2298]|nr:peptidyl-prolyl cis-trans isomerase C [Ochromonadaceae sp. CCMP2298]